MKSIEQQLIELLLEDRNDKNNPTIVSQSLPLVQRDLLSSIDNFQIFKKIRYSNNT